MIFKVTGIVWNTEVDDEQDAISDDDLNALPSEIITDDLDIDLEVQDVEDWISDWLSDNFDWLVDGFEWSVATDQGCVGQPLQNLDRTDHGAEA